MRSTDETGPNYRETIDRFWLLRLITEVRPDGLYVRLAPFHRSFRRVPASQIDDVTVTTYSPATYGGWHWGVRRSLGGNTAYRLRGDRGVELVLEGGRKIFIGSQSPSELETAVRRTMETA